MKMSITDTIYLGIMTFMNMCVHGRQAAGRNGIHQRATIPPECSKKRQQNSNSVVIYFNGKFEISVFFFTSDTLIVQYIHNVYLLHGHYYHCCPAKYPELAMQFARMLIVPRSSCAEPGRCIRKVHVLFCESCFMQWLQLCCLLLLLHCCSQIYTIQHFSQSNRLVADLQSRKRIGPDQSSLGHCLKKCSLFLAPKLLVYILEYLQTVIVFKKLVKLPFFVYHCCGEKKKDFF